MSPKRHLMSLVEGPKHPFLLTYLAIARITCQSVPQVDYRGRPLLLGVQVPLGVHPDLLMRVWGHPTSEKSITIILLGSGVVQWGRVVKRGVVVQGGDVLHVFHRVLELRG